MSSNIANIDLNSEVVLGNRQSEVDGVDISESVPMDEHGLLKDSRENNVPAKCIFGSGIGGADVGGLENVNGEVGEEGLDVKVEFVGREEIKPDLRVGDGGPDDDSLVAITAAAVTDRDEASVDFGDAIMTDDKELILELKDGAGRNPTDESLLFCEVKVGVVQESGELTELKDVNALNGYNLIHSHLQSEIRGDGQLLQNDEKEKVARNAGIASCSCKTEQSQHMKQCHEEQVDHGASVVVGSLNQDDTSTIENVDVSHLNVGLNSSGTEEVIIQLVDDNQRAAVEVDKSKGTLPKLDTNLNTMSISNSLCNETIAVDNVEFTNKNQDACISLSRTGVPSDIVNGHDLMDDVIDLNPSASKEGEPLTDEKVKTAVSAPEFHASDLVWGKVRSHPWWPGQIFDPSASSKKAKKYFKKDSYLITYFGDHTFAWNEASLIKPFREHFLQLENQSSFESFRHAVDCALEEISRRVEFGLACPCLPRELYSKLKTQVIINAGIQEESSRRDGGDSSSSAASFDPSKLVSFIKALAEFPHGEADRSEFVVSRAQVLAFSRWKGYNELPEFNALGGLFENETEFLLSGKEKQLSEDAAGDVKGNTDTSSGKELRKSQDSSIRKRKQDSVESMRPYKKERTSSDFMVEKLFNTPKCEDGYQRNKGCKSTSHSSGKKRKVVDAIADQNDHLQAPSGNKYLQSKLTFGVGDSIRRVARKLSGSNPMLEHTGGTSQETVVDNKNKATPVTNNPQSTKLGISEFPSLEEVLSQLCLAARDPMKGYKFLVSIVRFFSEFRNSISIDHSSTEGQEESHTQVSGVKTGKKSTKTGKQTPDSEDRETSDLELMKDSYWTDRIIQSIPEEQSTLGKVNETADIKDGTPVVEEQAAPSLDLTQEVGARNLESGAKGSGANSDDKEDFSPVALILNFTDFDSVPSVANLNEIFSRYGALVESNTEVLKKSSRAKVVFRRRSDAETAFSSAGKYSIFGPSLVSYRLKYMPNPPTKATRHAAKRCRKEATIQEEPAT